MKTIVTNKSASKGIVMGSAFIVNKLDLTAKNYDVVDTKHEIQKFRNALARAVEEISILAQNSEIFAAHLEVAEDITLHDSVESKILDDNKNSETALELATLEICEMFESVDDEYLKERANDIKDVSKRIMCHIKGVKMNVFEDINQEVIVVADDLTPSDTANMNFKLIKGFITASGGVTSHVAIIARQLEVPAIVGIGKEIEEIQKNDFIILDANGNNIIINPKDITKVKYMAKAREYKELKNKFDSLKNLPTITKDGKEIELFANVGNVQDVQTAVKYGCEGVGLFRTEFLYMENSHFPTEEEQFTVYKEAIETSNSTIIFRTLDIGGDKSLPYYKFDFEENPFLGWRAIRISLSLKDIFKNQLKALLRASAFGDVKIMYPMIISVNEFKLANEILEECKLELKSKNIKFNQNIQTGVMIETPASVFIAEDLAKICDFFSIGTNDLTQYLLAVDRGNQKISSLYNSFNPAVLRAINTVIKSAHKHGKKVGMCGEFASDEKAVPILLGMGLDEFSVASSLIPEIRYNIRNLSFKKSQELSEKILEQSTTEEVIEILNQMC